MIEEVKTEKEASIEVKRLYLPFKLETKCPECGNKAKCDLSGEEYLSYPTINKFEEVSFYCETCDEYIDVEVKLKVSLEINHQA